MWRVKRQNVYIHPCTTYLCMYVCMFVAYWMSVVMWVCVADLLKIFSEFHFGGKIFVDFVFSSDFLTKHSGTKGKKYIIKNKKLYE